MLPNISVSATWGLPRGVLEIDPRGASHDFHEPLDQEHKDWVMGCFGDGQMKVQVHGCGVLVSLDELLLQVEPRANGLEVTLVALTRSRLRAGRLERRPGRHHVDRAMFADQRCLRAEHRHLGRIRLCDIGSAARSDV